MYWLAAESGQTLEVNWLALAATIAVPIFVAMLGSSVLSTWIERLMMRGDGRAERAHTRADAVLTALGQLRSMVQSYESKYRNGGDVIDEERDLRFSKSLNRLMVAATATSDDKIRALCKDYGKVAERFVIGDEAIGREAEESSFDGLLAAISRYMTKAGKATKTGKG